MQEMMLIMQLGVKYTLSEFPYKNYPIHAVLEHIGHSNVFGRRRLQRYLS
jgi:hypothetical protein